VSTQPSEEELQAYLEQLRSTPTEEVLVQSFNMLAMAAQAKLGLRDARTLIDAMDAVQKAGAASTGQIGQQMASAVGQLKMAQVEAERQQTAEAGDAETGQEPETDAGRGGGAPEPPSAGADQAPGAGGQRMTDRLWIPGRGPRPS